MCVADVTFLSALVYLLHAECKSFCSPVYISIHCIHFRVAMSESQSERMTASYLLDIFDYDDLEDTEAVCGRLFGDMKKKLNLQTMRYVSSNNFTNDTKITRQVMADWLHRATDIMSRQASLMVKYKDIVEMMKVEAIADKTKVVTVQEKLLELKDEQLNNLKTAVQSAVQNSVEKEIKSYSQILQTKNSSGNGVSHDALKSVVKNALKEEDRSKNLVIFGLLNRKRSSLKALSVNCYLIWVKNLGFQ